MGSNFARETMSERQTGEGVDGGFGKGKMGCWVKPLGLGLLLVGIGTYLMFRWEVLGRGGEGGGGATGGGGRSDAVAGGVVVCVCVVAAAKAWGDGEFVEEGDGGEQGDVRAGA
jgi:hypothetical protein